METLWYQKRVLFFCETKAETRIHYYFRDKNHCIQYNLSRSENMYEGRFFMFVEW